MPDSKDTHTSKFLMIFLLVLGIFAHITNDPWGAIDFFIGAAFFALLTFVKLAYRKYIRESPKDKIDSEWRNA